MGKTTTAEMLAAHGLRIFDADAAVHRLYEKGGAAVRPIGELCPSAVVDGAVDRGRLKAWIAQDPARIEAVEKIVHPLVARERQAFLEDAGKACAWAVVLDIPLLFETGGAALMDAIIVVTASPETQRQRMLARPGMTAAQAEMILARQMPDAEKRARADYLVDTDKGMDAARQQIDGILAELRRKTGRDTGE